MIGWALGLTMQWLLFEPAALGLAFGCTALLKWCTTFAPDDEPAEEPTEL